MVGLIAERPVVFGDELAEPVHSTRSVNKVVSCAENDEKNSLLGLLGLGGLDEAARLEPVTDGRVGPRVVGGVTGPVIVATDEIEQLVASVRSLALDDAVLGKPVAL